MLNSVLSRAICQAYYIYASMHFGLGLSQWPSLQWAVIGFDLTGSSPPGLLRPSVFRPQP